MKKIILLVLSLAIFPVLASNEGDQVPDCVVKNFYDKQGINEKIELNKLKGKVVYVDFWASWCPPCKLSFPSLNTLYKELKGKGFEVVAINLDEEKQDAKKFLADVPVDFSIGYDPEGECPRLFDVMAMPSAYILDKKGVIRTIHLGFKKADIIEIRKAVLALLNE